MLKLFIQADMDAYLADKNPCFEVMDHSLVAMDPYFVVMDPYWADKDPYIAATHTCLRILSLF